MALSRLWAALFVPALASPAAFPPTDASWERVPNNPVLSSTDAWENTCVCEPQVMWEPTEQVFRMYYRGGWGTQAVGVATSRDGLHWEKYAGNPVYASGDSQDGGQPWVYKAGEDNYWLFTTSNVPPKVNVARSEDGYNWTTQDSKIDLPSGGWLWGNRAVWKEESGWKMLQEVRVSGWLIYLYTSQDGFSWTVGNDGAPIPVADGSVSGPSIANVDGVLTPLDANGTYNLWYHAAQPGGLLPTDVYHATSQDLLTWTVSPATPVLQHVGSGFEFDQTADPSPVVVGTKAFLFYDGDNNEVGTCAIGAAVPRAAVI